MAAQKGELCRDTTTGLVYVKSGLLATDWMLWDVQPFPLSQAMGGTGGTNAATALAALGAVAAGLVPWSGCRKLGFGSTVVNALSTVTLLTATRTAGELLLPCAFISSSVAGLGFSFTNTGAVGVSYWFERTTNADEVIFRARNVDVTNRNLDWMVLGITP